MPILPPVVRQLLAARVDHNVILRLITKLLAVELRDSTLHGQGLFATQSFEIGTFICPIFGTVLPASYIGTIPVRQKHIVRSAW